LLPVGVIPITSAVTEIQYDGEERADITFQDAHTARVPVADIGEFISGIENADNAKGVARVSVELPSMERYQGIRFVDTPGLDSVFEHNTDASLEWLPNVGLALVAVGVDPPLSQRDLELIRNLKRYTPRIGLLLTKVDLLEEPERRQVQDFVHSQLARCWGGSVPLFPFSIRPGFEQLHQALDESLLAQVRQDVGGQRKAILRHKTCSLIEECTGYLRVALRSAEASDSEQQLQRRILGEKESLADTRLGLQLIVRHAAAGARARFEALLKPDEAAVRQGLIAGLQTEFPAWTRSLRVALEHFEDWLPVSLSREIAGLSQRHYQQFIEPVQHVSCQLSQSLQDFRNRLSDRTLETLGVPLRTTEVELSPEAPRTPDVRVGKVFDRNWELLSAVLPMVNASLLILQKESERRLGELIASMERLITAAGEEAPQIRADLERLAALQGSLEVR
jgi:hypothetical protein